MRRNFLAALKPQKGERAVRIPTPAGAENWRSQGCLLQNRLHGFGVEEMENVAEWEAVLLGKRYVQTIVGCRSLELKIEAAAETLAQGQSPGFIDARAERRMDDQLHASAFIEKAFGNDGALGWDIAENGAALKNVLNGLGGSRFIEATFLDQPGNGFCDPRILWRERDGRNAVQTLADFVPQLGHVKRKLLRPCRRFPIPEWNGWRRSMRIFDQHPTRPSFYAMNAPGGVPQQHYVASVALDREVFVERANDNPFRSGHYGEQRGFGYGAAAGNCGQSGSSTGAQLSVYAIVMQVGAVASAASSNAFRKHFQNRIKEFAREIAVWIGAFDQPE